MNSEMAVNAIKSSIDTPASKLQGLFKRKTQQDITIPILEEKQTKRSNKKFKWYI
jgi:hypothetical protein